MKKLLLLCASLFTIALSFGQNELNTQTLTITSDKFCILNIASYTKHMFNIKLEYEANMDSVVVNQLKNVPSRFKTRVEILNYMSSIGWTFVSGTIVFSNSFEYPVFFFRKSFPKKEN